MANIIKIVTWNANGLHNHLQELQEILDINKIDVSYFRHTSLSSPLSIPGDRKFNIQITPKLQPEVEV
jgi:hypothetical protein